MLKLKSNQSKKLSDVLGLSAFILLCATLIFVLALRIQYINRIFGGIVDCDNCFVMNVLIFDGPYLGGIIVIYLLSLTISNLWIRLALRLTVFAGVVIYAADHMVSQNLYTRLILGDVQTYGQQAGLILDHIKSTGMLTQHPTLVMGLAVVLILFLLACPTISINRKALTAIATPFLLWIGASLILQPTIYVHNWAMRNVVAANFSAGVTVDYSDAFQRTLLTSDPSLASCTAEAQPQGNIVLLILESWSPYQSKLWDGEHDWTPKIDEIARRNLRFSNFYAGGFTTNEGLSSILAGVEFYSPVTNFFDAKMFEGLWDLENTLPHALNKAGYDSIFLTTGDLSFGEKGAWLTNIGFNTIEGHDFIGYEGLPRLHFRSAADEHLYARALETLDNAARANREPIFLTIENVSTHQPFIHPHTREQNKESVFRYMDDTVAEFYAGLEERNFFHQGGVLVVVSDHRSMTPISKHEHENFGELAASRIPAFIASDRTPAMAVNSIFHQADILPTLQHYTSPGCPPAKWDLLNASKSEARCVFHARGDQRDYIDVICSDGTGRVKLRGDDTTFIQSENISSAQQQILLDRINLTRLKQRQNHQMINTKN